MFNIMPCELKVLKFVLLDEGGHSFLVSISKILCQKDPEFFIFLIPTVDISCIMSSIFFAESGIPLYSICPLGTSLL